MKTGEAGTVPPVIDQLIHSVVTQCRPLRFRGKARLADLLIPRTGKREALIYGSRFSLDMSDFIQRHMYAGSFEREETNIVHKTVRPGMTFVDVGANVGYYTALAAHLVGPTGSVFAFEPSDYAYPRLSAMIEANGLSWVHAMKCGLAEVAGDRVLYGGVEEDLFQNHTATMVPNDNPNQTVVRTETLDRMAEQLEIKHIDFMKIDVDGFEPLVVQGAAGLIASGRISAIMLECAEDWFNRMNTNTVEFVDHLRSKGFSKISKIGAGSEFCTYLFHR